MLSTIHSVTNVSQTTGESATNIYLSLSGQSLETIPSLPLNLQVLDVSFNCLQSIPSLTKLAHLKIIDSRGNKLITIPLLNRAVEQLLLCRNRINTIESKNIQNCTNLTLMDLSYNDISVLPMLILPSLTDLNLSHNKLKSIPNLSSMSSLQVLKVNYNALETVLLSLSQIRTLQVLELSSNKLKVLPSELFESMHSLRRLTLDSNPLSEIPDLSDLISLELLDISLTDIRRLPPSLAKVSGLGCLYLDSPVEDGQVIYSVLDNRVDSYELIAEGDRELCREGLESITKEMKRRILMKEDLDN